MSKKSYLRLASHYRECLLSRGDSSSGMDWPRERENRKRFEIMYGLFEPALKSASGKVSVLDFGCGTSHFFEFLKEQGVSKKVSYTGIDIVEESVRISKNKFPANRYFCLDVIADNRKLPVFDFAVLNGVFTQKRTMSDREMKEFLSGVLLRLFPAVRYGLAFNTMSYQVDYKLKGAFHPRLDWMAALLAERLSRNFIVRHDYGLYENTFFVYKKEQLS